MLKIPSFSKFFKLLRAMRGPLSLISLSETPCSAKICLMISVTSLLENSLNLRMKGYFE